VFVFPVCRAGNTAAEFAANHFRDCLLATAEWRSGDRSETALCKALTSACLALDALMARIPGFQVRCSM
jgi:hypothetical protein